MSDSIDRYVGHEYGALHPGWHEEDAASKADDIVPFVERAVRGSREVRLVDIGCGTGTVVALTKRALERGGRHTVQAVGVDPAPVPLSDDAVLEGVARVVGTDVGDAERFDVALLIDVLEHLDNPRACLIDLRRVANHVVVRQPLLDSLGTYRHSLYREQRTKWGHINYWNHRSFDDLMLGCGWVPVDTRLVAPWELSSPNVPARPVQRIVTKLSRTHASIVISGFYTVGLYRPATATGD